MALLVNAKRTQSDKTNPTRGADETNQNRPNLDWLCFSRLASFAGENKANLGKQTQSGWPQHRARSGTFVRCLPCAQVIARTRKNCRSTPENSQSGRLLSPPPRYPAAARFDREA